MDKVLADFGSLKERLVFITDEAVWLRNWIADSFPAAVSILDYYHTVEHLHDFSSQFFKDKEKGGQWSEQQKELLYQLSIKDRPTKIV